MILSGIPKYQLEQEKLILWKQRNVALFGAWFIFISGFLVLLVTEPEVIIKLNFQIGFLFFLVYQFVNSFYIHKKINFKHIMRFWYMRYTADLFYIFFVIHLIPYDKLNGNIFANIAIAGMFLRFLLCRPHLKEVLLLFGVTSFFAVFLVFNAKGPSFLKTPYFISISLLIFYLACFIYWATREFFKKKTEVTPVNYRNELKQIENLASIGQLASALADEIRTPLTSTQSFIQLFHNSYSEKDRESLKIILKELSQVNNLLKDFLILAKPQLNCDKASLNSLLEEAISCTEEESLTNGVTVRKSFLSYELYTALDKHQMKQVFINIIRNGIEAMPEGGTLTVRIKEKVPFKTCQIDFVDEGIGIAPEDLNKIFNAFYTTKTTGTGLGLTISAKIIKDHGGDFNVNSAPGNGTTFTIELPLI